MSMITAIKHLGPNVYLMEFSSPGQQLKKYQVYQVVKYSNAPEEVRTMLYFPEGDIKEQGYRDYIEKAIAGITAQSLWPMLYPEHQETAKAIRYKWGDFRE